MSNLSLTFAVGSLGVLLLGVAPGCGTNEKGTGGLLQDGGGTGGSANADSGPGLGSQTPLGRACLKDSECGGGLVCITSDSKALSGGGPPHGMCTADCSSAGTPTCKTLDPSSTCVQFSAPGTPIVAYCMETCVIGKPTTGEQKCHQRLDVSCGLADPTSNDPSGFCVPTCRNDGDCGSRRCDVGTGFCMDATDITGTLPIGSPCDPSLARDPCEGTCMVLTSNDAGTGPGICGGICPFGSLGCGVDPISSAPPAAACLFAYPGSDSGDLGFCGQLCDCNDDCKAPQRTCRPFSAGDVQAFGRQGYCGGLTDSTTGKPAQSIPCTNIPDATAPGSDGGHVPPEKDASTGVKDAGKPTTRLDAGDAH